MNISIQIIFSGGLFIADGGFGIVDAMETIPPWLYAWVSRLRFDHGNEAGDLTAYGRDRTKSSKRTVGT